MPSHLKALFNSCFFSHFCQWKYWSLSLLNFAIYMADQWQKRYPNTDSCFPRDCCYPFKNFHRFSLEVFWYQGHLSDWPRIIVKFLAKGILALLLCSSLALVFLMLLWQLQHWMALENKDVSLIALEAQVQTQGVSRTTFPLADLKGEKEWVTNFW